MKLGFIGAGQMATALAQGLIDGGLVPAESVLASDPAPAAAEHFARVTGAATVSTNAEVAGLAEVIVLAVKPQQIDAVLADLAGLVARQLVISIAAGVPLERLSRGLGGHGRLIRVMPNTPCLVRKSASAYCAAEGVTEADTRLVERLLAAVGTVVRLEEKLLDAVTGLSGSGPAFVYVMIEALSDGGVNMGLPRGVATELAAQTVLGAAQMVLATGEHPGQLKDRVASPAGTTIAGLEALEQGGFRAALIAAVAAATRRSVELGRASDARPPK